MPGSRRRITARPSSHGRAAWLASLSIVVVTAPAAARGRDMSSPAVTPAGVEALTPPAAPQGAYHSTLDLAGISLPGAEPRGASLFALQRPPARMRGADLAGAGPEGMDVELVRIGGFVSATDARLALLTNLKRARP